MTLGYVTSKGLAAFRAPMPSLVYMFSSFPAFGKQRTTPLEMERTHSAALIGHHHYGELTP